MLFVSFERSVESYLLDSTTSSGFKVDKFFAAVGTFIGVFGGSFALGFAMGLVTALVSFAVLKIGQSISWVFFCYNYTCIKILACVAAGHVNYF